MISFKEADLCSERFKDLAAFEISAAADKTYMHSILPQTEYKEHVSGSPVTIMITTFKLIFNTSTKPKYANL